MSFGTSPPADGERNPSSLGAKPPPLATVGRIPTNETLIGRQTQDLHFK